MRVCYTITILKQADKQDREIIKFSHFIENHKIVKSARKKMVISLFDYPGINY